MATETEHINAALYIGIALAMTMQDDNCHSDDDIERFIDAMLGSSNLTAVASRIRETISTKYGYQAARVDEIARKLQSE